MITPSIEYDYLIKFLALGDSGVGMLIKDLINYWSLIKYRKNNISLSIY